MPNKLTIFPESPPPSQPLKTGQTTPYHTADDGDLQKGISKEYTILTTGLYNGTINITINSKTHALSNNCVKDNKTGLMWARYVPLNDIGPDSTGELLWIDAVNAEDIWSFLAQANLNCLGGHYDWRIPNLFELLSILNVGAYDPCIDTTTFPSTPSEFHWTSTTYPGDTTSAFRLLFSRAHVSSRRKETGNYYVRLVRG